MKNRKGFTLMEIMVVILIIAGLAAISYPLYTKAITKARIAEAVALTEIVREAQQRNLVLKNEYFPKFVAAHVSGRTRLIKARDVTISEGALQRGLYTVTIGDSSSVTNGCIIVKYGSDVKNPIFTIYTHVEDSKIWCEEIDDSNGICSIIPSLEITDNDCN